MTIDRSDEILEKLDAFLRAYDDLRSSYPETPEPPKKEDDRLAGQVEQIVRMEEKIDVISDWMRSIDARFASLVTMMDNPPSPEEDGGEG